MYYAITTFGSPRPRQKSYYGSEAAALRDARDMKGSGTCSCVRVYACETRNLATTADISEVREGERIVCSY